MKTLVVYYSAQGHTKKIAEKITEELGADIFEIEPETAYSEEDLDWTNPDSRCSRENDEPELREMKLKVSSVPNWNEYDRVILGYPIWWGIAAWPTNAFVKNVDFAGKTVLPFCTSHSSGIGDSDLMLKSDASSGDWKDGVRFFQDAGDDKIKAWADELK